MAEIVDNIDSLIEVKDTATRAPKYSIKYAVAFGREGAVSQFHVNDERKDDTHLRGSVTEVAEPVSARQDTC